VVDGVAGDRCHGTGGRGAGGGGAGGRGEGGGGLGRASPRRQFFLSLEDQMSLGRLRTEDGAH
jgi:hypothetical protein